MADPPAYAIVGSGRWASKIKPILLAEGRQVTSLSDIRRAPGETEENYISRLRTRLEATGAQFAWLCVPPGPHVESMLRAALEASLHVVVEKPWLCSRSQTDALTVLANAAARRVAVHYQYCFLKEVQAWRTRWMNVPGLRFGGRFAIGRPDRLGIPAAVNLGSHLLAIRRYATPQAALGEVSCDYEAREERRVWIDTPEGKRLTVDFGQHSQPLVQRFFRAFETATETAPFAFDLSFARDVADDLDELVAACR